VDYHIQLPINHPAGAFWFHPHMHGDAGNQIAAGMSGIISVGSVGTYACGDELCYQPFPDGKVRHLIIKDMQVLAGPNGGTGMFQQDPTLCDEFPMPGEPTRNGSCQGDPATYPGDLWFFTVNGQQFPTIPIATGDGEIWRFQNASASATYDIELTDNSTNKPIMMQLISVDGVSVQFPQGITSGQVVQLGSARFTFANCPLAPPSSPPAAQAAAAAAFGSQPVCVTDLFMMPSSRVEVWVAYRDANGNLIAAAAGATATLQTVGVDTGPTGDDWPAVNLATVQFPAGQVPLLTSNALHLHGQALTAMQPNGIFNSPVPGAVAAPLPAGCVALAPGHMRRIYYGNPTLPSAPSTPGEDQYGNSVFGLGYEELDQYGNPVPGTLVDLTRFDPANVICLPLGPGQMPVTETWQIINLTTELHNFHIHQTKFRTVDTSAAAGSLLSPTSTQGAGVMEDNVPLPFASPGPNSQPVLIPGSGSCTIADYKSGNCQVTPITVQIPFSKLGEFVYHCHILEHEDGGMMHAIEVVPSPY
jgi:FtsP/CotA-like multicopper oxidase with cupredoxin domain